MFFSLRIATGNVPVNARRLPYILPNTGPFSLEFNAYRQLNTFCVQKIFKKNGLNFNFSEISA